MVEVLKVKKLTSGSKKFEVLFPDGKKVKFGQMNASDYTIHKSPQRMARYVARHGGRQTKETAPRAIHKDMLTVRSSTKENWSKNGVKSPGFWSRWVLWSRPSLSGGIREAKTVLGPEYRVVLQKS